MLSVDIYVHVTFLLLLGFIGVAHGLAGRSVEAALTVVVFFAGIFLCVLLHEFSNPMHAGQHWRALHDQRGFAVAGRKPPARSPGNHQLQFGPGADAVYPAHAFAVA